MRSFKPSSSMIKEVRWVPNSRDDNRNGSLYVQFSNNNVYRYSNVSLSKFTWFSRAESAGSFFDAKIKGEFPSTRLPNGFPKKALASV